MAIGFDKPDTKKRSDDDYAIESALKVFKVLEALEGANFEPVSLDRVQQRTQFPPNFCYRALKTLKVAGYVTEKDGLWSISSRAMRFSERFINYAEEVLDP